MKTCDLCKQTTRADGVEVVYFGEWMTKGDITVHYFCLLLSTHLPQQGQDHSGILGFLLRDIRKELELAKSRICFYCSKTSATIKCHSCSVYFHMSCGFTSCTLSQFVGQFRSYCHNCIPHDGILEKIKKKMDVKKSKCCICIKSMGYYEPTRWIYGKCCGNGFAHSKCVKVYALRAGYYLKCIWCKSKRFREDVKYLGVFVPDRDAAWELEKGAYMDLYRGHQRCDMEKCICPKGRDFQSAHKWPIINCMLCGSFGAHNPACIPGMEKEKEKIKEFKCHTCSVTEQTLHSETLPAELTNEHDLIGINATLYIQRDVSIANNSSVNSVSRAETVTKSVLLENKTASSSSFRTQLLTQPNGPTGHRAIASPSTHLSQHTNIIGVLDNDTSDRNLNEPDPIIINRQVQRLLAFFDP